jgi:aromatic amino acid lyase
VWPRSTVGVNGASNRRRRACPLLDNSTIPSRQPPAGPARRSPRSDDHPGRTPGPDQGGGRGGGLGRPAAGRDPGCPGAGGGRQAELAALLAGGARVYGVNTGMGWLASVDLDAAAQEEHQRNLLLGRAVGGPPWLEAGEVRALLVARLANLLSGHAGVGPELVRFLVDRVNDGFLPAVPRSATGGARGGDPLGPRVPDPGRGGLRAGAGREAGGGRGGPGRGGRSPTGWPPRRGSRCSPGRRRPPPWPWPGCGPGSGWPASC